MIKTVVFDLDNTLYDYDYCNRIAEIELYRKMKTYFKIDTINAEKLLADAKRNIKKRLGNTAASHNRLLYMQNICEQLNVKPGLYALKLYNAYWDVVLTNMQRYSYVLPLLETLHKKKLVLGILTDLTAHIQYRKLEALEISDFFDMIITSEEAGEDKPSDKMFNLLFEKTKNNPDELLMIGDSQEKDIAGAQKHGINTILYTKHTDIIKEAEKYI